MKHVIAVLLAASVCSGCGNSEVSPPSGVAAAADAAASAQMAAPNARPGRRATALPGRTEELTQPDEAALVFLYYGLAQIPLPFDAVIQRDSRVAMAQPADKAAMRDQVRAELTAGLRAVERVGRLRMPLNADLSHYDSSYQEFTVGAFSPSSVFTFQAFGEKVQLKFRNAREAQTWQVAADEAQGIRDKLGYSGATVDALLNIVDVLPAPGGGVIVADVIEYDVRSYRGGQRLGRVQVMQ